MGQMRGRSTRSLHRPRGGEAWLILQVNYDGSVCDIGYTFPYKGQTAHQDGELSWKGVRLAISEVVASGISLLPSLDEELRIQVDNFRDDRADRMPSHMGGRGSGEIVLRLEEPDRGWLLGALTRALLCMSIRRLLARLPQSVRSTVEVFRIF